MNTRTGGSSSARLESVARGLLVLQFAALVALSVHIFNRFNLGIDYADFASAWSEIGKGHLDPYSTVSGFSYLHNHFELIMWSLALAYPVFHSPFVLLLVQDASIAGTNLVVFAWILAVVRRQEVTKRTRRVVVLLSTIALLLNPEIYQTVALDFHFEPTAVFFCVLAGYDLWAGRRRRCWVWIALCLSCGDIGGIYVIGIGLSAVLASRNTRLNGLLAVGAGVSWVGLISALGANKGSLISAGYAYLAGRPELSSGIGGLFLIVGGAIAHPTLPLTIIGRRIGLILGYMRPVGLVGFASAWGFGVPFITLFTSSVQFSPLFIETPFQNFAVYPFVLVGLAFVAPHAATLASNRRTLTAILAVTAVGLLVSMLAFDAYQLPPSPHKNATNNFYSPGEAAVLHKGWALTPKGAEVIGSIPVMGRFGDRPYIYPFDDAGRPIPLRTDTIVLVVDIVHPTGLISIPNIQSAADYALSVLHGRVLAQGDGAFVVEWHRKLGSRTVELP